jgi:hypothetical protein
MMWSQEWRQQQSDLGSVTSHMVTDVLLHSPTNQFGNGQGFGFESICAAESQDQYFGQTYISRAPQRASDLATSPIK